MLDGGTRGFADDVQLALQGVLHDHIGTPTDKHLADDGFFLTHGGRHRHIAVHGYVTPAQKHLAFSLDGAFHFLFARHTRGMLFRHKHHAHAVFAGGRQLHTH